MSLECPICGCTLNSTKETRDVDGGIRRRKMCFNLHKFTSLETVFTEPFPRIRRTKAVEPAAVSQTTPQIELFQL